MMNMSSLLRIAFVLLAAGTWPVLHAQDKGGKEPVRVLPVNGRVTDGENKLAGCLVTTFIGNEAVATQTTDKGGRFAMGLEMDKLYALEFRKEGHLPKRILIDTHAKLPEGEIIFEPLQMDLSLLPLAKYEGADTDELDFPFALVRFDKRVGAFAIDDKYTRDMMMTNGALLLAAGRASKR
jgi:hypothetical protein